MAVYQCDSFLGIHIGVAERVNVFIDTDSLDIFAQLDGGGVPRSSYEEYDHGTVDPNDIVYQYCDYDIGQLVTVRWITKSPYGKVETEIDSPVCQPVPPTCNLVVNSIIVTNETQQNGNDGTLNATASSINTGIEFSLNNVDWQSSGVFTNLAPGSYTVYVRDSAGCTNSKTATIVAYDNPVPPNDTLFGPVVQYGPGNISRWNAAFNKIAFDYQRSDAKVSSVVYNAADATITVSFTPSLSASDLALVQANKFIYLNSGLYIFYKEAFSVTASQVVFNGMPDLGTVNSGLLVFSAIKKNFKVDTEITSGFLFDVVKLICTNSPDQTGKTKAELQQYLKTLLSAVDLFQYDRPAWIDNNLARYFSIRYREYWDGDASRWFVYPDNLYVTYAAMQLGERYGGNMAEYVTFYNQPDPSKLAKFLTDFPEPAYNLDYPFDISFIKSEYLKNVTLYAEFTTLDINRVPVENGLVNSYITNEDGTYILQEDGAGKLVLEYGTGPVFINVPLEVGIGICRLMLPASYNPAVYFVKVKLFYFEVDGTTKHYVTEEKTVQLLRPCENDPNVYIKWINHLGTWDYHLFTFDQTISTITKNDSVIERNIDNWEFSQTVSDLIKKTGSDKMIVGSDFVDENELKPLKWLRNSIKVQMLIDPLVNKWQTVVVSPGTFEIMKTRRGTGKIKITLELPDINIQTQ